MSSPLLRSRRFWLAHAVLPFLAFGTAALLFEVSSLDFAVSDRFFDFTAGRWTFRDAWWAEGLIHKAGSKLILLIALGSLAGWALSFFLERIRHWQRAFLFLLLSIALGTGLVAFGKETTNRHCPWDYDRYGGPVVYTRLFTPAPPDSKEGNCFPAGHASGGFSLMSLYFVFAGRSRRRAVAGLSIGIALGSIFGFGQIARGAHFLSHTLWTAAVCWYSALLLYAAVFQGRLFGEEEHTGPGA